MKKSDYNRVLSLYKNTKVDLTTCIQLLLEISDNKGDAAATIIEFLRDIGTSGETIYF